MMVHPDLLVAAASRSCEGLQALLAMSYVGCMSSAAVVLTVFSGLTMSRALQLLALLCLCCVCLCASETVCYGQPSDPPSEYGNTKEQWSMGQVTLMLLVLLQLLWTVLPFKGSGRRL